MRIGVVAHELEGRPTGVGRYLEGLLGGLATVSPPGWSWRLFLRHAEGATTLPGPSDGRFETVDDGRPGMHPVVWEQLRLPWLLARHPVDLLFCPGYAAPLLSPTPAVVTLHDLSFEALPEEFGWRERWRRRVLARLAVRSARRLLADTDRGAAEIARRYGVSRSAIGVVPLGVDDRFTPAAQPQDASLLAGLGVRPPYLLAVGSLLPRRDPAVLLAAFGAVAAEHPDLELVVAGADRLRRPDTLAGLVASSGVGERVRHLDYVADGALPALYRGAVATCYLSVYEGYGLPPLESLACGTVAVVAAAPALLELWPDYPYRGDFDGPSVAALLRRALGSPAERLEVAAEGRRRVARLGWPAAAERLVSELALARRSG